jgi:pumilio family protein 6
MIMRSLKGHMMEVAKSEHGHLILLALFDTVDDTVLLRKVCIWFR